MQPYILVLILDLYFLCSLVLWLFACPLKKMTWLLSCLQLLHGKRHEGVAMAA